MRILKLTFFLLLSAVACSKNQSGHARLSIQLPKAQSSSSSQKMTSLSAPPAGQKLCYAVNVTGSGITNVTAACQPSMGMLGGFTDAGGTISMDIQKGTGRHLELYLYLFPAGDNGACPTLTATGFAALDKRRVYLVGSVASFGVTQDDQSVDVPASFPGQDKNYIVQTGMPVTCIGSADTQDSYNSPAIVAGGGVMTGTQFKLKGQIGGPVSSAAGMQGSSYKIKTMKDN